MHSKDRTLLAQMGFADPDRKETRHEQAIQYLSLKPQMEKVWKAVLTGDRPVNFNGEGSNFPAGGGCRFRYVTTLKTEVPVNKGANHYKSTVGFLDLTCSAVIHSPPTKYEDPDNYTPRSTEKTLVIEVKIKPIPTSDLIRQINLYREYAAAWFWVAVTDYSISEHDARLLAIAGISHLRMGESFNKWIEIQAVDRRAAESPAV